MNPEQLDRTARKRVGAKLGFYIHATVFVLGSGSALYERMVQAERRRLA